MSTPLKVLRPPERPLMVFDGDCGLCRRWIARWRFLTGNRLDYRPYQEVASQFPEIPITRFENAVQLIGIDGMVSEGAEAVAGALRHSVFGSIPLRLYHSFPGLGRLAERAYRWVAEHRGRLSRVGTIFYGQVRPPYSYILTRAIFLRVLGFIYLMVFLIFWRASPDPMLTFDNLFPGAAALPGGSDTLILQGVCALGILQALILMSGFLPAAALLGAWLAGIALLVISPEGLGHPWHMVLLEAGLIAIFYAPLSLSLRDSHRHPPAWLARLLLWWLLLRVGIFTGLVGLENPTTGSRGWTTTMLGAVALILPWMIVLPRRLRLTAAGGLILLQLIDSGFGGDLQIGHLLTLALCIPLLDDSVWPQAMRRRLAGAAAGQLNRRWLWILVPHRIALAALAAVILSVSLPQVRLAAASAVTSLFHR